MRRASILISVSIVLIGGAWAGVCRADLSTGLVAHYAFNGNANDLSGNGNHGTIQGGAGFTVDHWGNPNGAIHFDGVDDYVLLPNESSFDLNPFSIVITARVPDYSRENYLISKGLRFGNYTMKIEPEYDPWHYGRIGWPMYNHEISGYPFYTGTTVSNGPVPLNEYFQLAVTYDPALYRGYMNGSLGSEWTPAAPAGPMPPPVLNNDPVLIGAGGYWTPFSLYLGDIDEVRIYNRVLAASEISALNTQVNPVPLPGAALLGAFGLSFAGWRLKRQTV